MRDVEFFARLAPLRNDADELYVIAVFLRHEVERLLREVGCPVPEFDHQRAVGVHQLMLKIVLVGDYGILGAERTLTKHFPANARCCPPLRWQLFWHAR